MKDWITTFNTPDHIHKAWAKMLEVEAIKGYHGKPKRREHTSQLLNAAMVKILKEKGYEI